MLPQESVVGELPTSIPNMVHHALHQDLEVLHDLSVGENATNDAFEKVK